MRHWIVLGALASGISLGAWIDHSGGGLAHSVASGIEAIGTLWLNALRMTVGPLVFSMLVAAVASVSDAMATGRLASRAIGWFTFLLLVAGTLAVLLTQGLLAFAVAVLAAHVGLYFGVFMALVGEVVGIFRGRLMAAIVAAAYLIALALIAYGLSFGWSELTWWAVSSLPMTLFVVIYVTLYSRQAEARERAQLLASELEVANRQLSDYAARVEDLTIAAERQRLARELHDTLSQGLAGLILQLEAADAHLGHQRADKARAIVADAMAQARVTLADARRAIDDLRRSAPGDLGSELCREVARFAEATGITADCRVAPELDLSDDVAETALRVVSEALTNVARHGQAQRVAVAASVADGLLQLTIEDDGVGFDPAAVPTGHYGLIGMRERARLAGGQVDVRSRPGAGATVTARLPLEMR